MPMPPVIVNNTPLVALWTLSLTLTGTLGILLSAKQKQLIPAVALLIQQLEQSGLRLSAELVQKVLILAQET